MEATAKLERLANVTNGAKATIDLSLPYRVSVEITGSSDIIFHAWNCESVEAKSTAAKNSKAKKTDDIESYVYRNDDGEICLPGEYLRQSVINSARYKQDPRSPRKSAKDLYKAGIVSLTSLASLGSKDWDYLRKCRVVIHQNAITRIRPAFKTGWKAQIEFLILLPEYISPESFRETIEMAGRLVGVGDERPSFGRFGITRFEVLKDK